MSRTTFDRRTALLAVLAMLFICMGLAAALLPRTWIESLFGAGPDNGDGAFELLVAFVPAAIGLALGTIAVLRWRSAESTVRRGEASRTERGI